MDYEMISKNASQFLALTSLHPPEFETLLANFAPACEKYFRYWTLEGKRRKIVTSKEHGSAKLRGSAQKLFFLMVYLKTNALQAHQAASFGISQPKVSRLSGVLRSLLHETLAQMQLTPFRDGSTLSSQLAQHPTKVFTYDGLERGILRNACDQAQEQEYSGKKKGIA